MAPIDLKGQTIGYWKVLEYYPARDNKGNKWLCECICGKKREIRPTDLLSGKSKSCGCRRKEFLQKAAEERKKSNTQPKKRKRKKRSAVMKKPEALYRPVPITPPRKMTMADMDHLLAAKMRQDGAGRTFSSQHPPYSYTPICPDPEYRRL
jgi:hypothetical protein